MTAACRGIRARLALVTAVVLAVGTMSCSKEGAPAPAPASAAPPASAPGAAPTKPSLVLITMEATRADHLGCYGDSQAATPGLDRLAREGAIFEQAIAVVPLTRPSHASIFTGLYPARHGVRDDDSPALPEMETTLAEHLKAQGYATAAAVGARILASDVGLKQGFDSYAEPKRGSRGAAFVVDDAVEAITRLKGGPFFLWVQLNDPHAPYAPPPGLRTRFEKRLYDGEIAWIDIQLSRLFEHLRASGRFDDTVVVVTADHGESLGEHGEDTHGLFLYDSTLKVPLIVRFPPRIAAGTKFTGLVSGVDLAPTLLELMRLPEMETVQGESCAARLLGGNAPERDVVFAESLFGERAFGWTPLYAMRSPKKKFVSAPESEFYDLLRDPSETINLAANEAMDLKGIWRPALDEALIAMGAAIPEAPASRADGTPRQDPKALVAASNLFLAAQMAIEEGHPEQAAPLLKQALAKVPGNPAATSLLAALRGEPVPQTVAPTNSFASQWNLGNSLLVHGKLDEAANAFRAALALNPASAETHYALGNVLFAQGDAAGAERELRAAVATDPKMAHGWNSLGILLDKTNRRPEALLAFSQALDASPDDADALFNRARVELLDHKLQDARRDLDRLLVAHPDYTAGRFLEAHLFVAEQNSPAAKDALHKFLALPNTDARMKAAAQKLLDKLGG